MTPVRRTWAVGVLSAVLGVATIGTGLYFAFLRPPMLPEDVRRTGVARDALSPAFADWLHVVFRTWGGFMVGLGAVLVGFALYLLRGGEGWLRGGFAVGVVVAFGSFLASNVQLRSDFLWYIALLFGLAAAVAATAWPRRAR